MMPLDVLKIVENKLAVTGGPGMIGLNGVSFLRTVYNHPNVGLAVLQDK
jgi:hypothetical protein